MPKIKTRYLIGSLLTAGLMAYLGFWMSLAVIAAFWLFGRLLGAILRFSGAILAGAWSILTWRGRYADHPLLSRDIKTLFK